MAEYFGQDDAWNYLSSCLKFKQCPMMNLVGRVAQSV